MPETVNWEQRGYCDYPRCDLYPFRDTHSEAEEKEYLTGWNKKRKELLSDNQIIRTLGEG